MDLIETFKTIITNTLFNNNKGKHSGRYIEYTPRTQNVDKDTENIENEELEEILKNNNSVDNGDETLIVVRVDRNNGYGYRYVSRQKKDVIETREYVI